MVSNLHRCRHKAARISRMDRISLRKSPDKTDRVSRVNRMSSSLLRFLDRTDRYSQDRDSRGSNPAVKCSRVSR